MLQVHQASLRAWYAAGLSAHRLCPVWLHHSPRCLWRLAPDDAGRRALFTLLRNKWTLDLWQGQS